MEQKTDRRIRKTKRLLRQGFAKLMQTKSIKEITVKELVEEVDINRSTFYLHYTDIYDMLEKVEDELMEEIITLIPSASEQIENMNQSYPFIFNLFTMLDQNRDICTSLVGPHGDLSFVTRIENYIFSNSEKYHSRFFPAASEDEMKYVHAYCITGCVGIVKKWLTEPNEDSPEHMAKIIYNMLLSSLESFMPQNKISRKPKPLT